MAENDSKPKEFKSSRVSRLLKVGSALAKATGHLAAEKVSGLVREKNELVQSLSNEISSSSAQIRAAKEIIQGMGQLKGGLMKIGQMISITEDLLLPKEITALFKSLQQSAPAMSESDLNRVFRRNFSSTPDKIFLKFEYRPMAAASIGQVHRATLKTGEKVAVKVQYPEIVSAIKSDLQNLDQLDRLFSMLLPNKPHIRPMLEELRNTLIDECNYQKEIENLAFFRKAFSQEFGTRVKIATEYPELSTLEILTTELMEGSTFDQTLDWDQEERNQLGEILYQSFLYSFFNLGALHSDPQNGNYLFNKTQIIIMDFGSVKYFSPEFQNYYTGILISIENHDLKLFRVCALNLKMIRADDPTDYVQKQFNLIEKIYRPFLGHGIFPIMDLNPFYLIKEFFSDINLKGKSAPHNDFLLMDRANIGLFSKLKYWGSALNWEEGRKKYRYSKSHQVVEYLNLHHPELQLNYEH